MLSGGEWGFLAVMAATMLALVVYVLRPRWIMNMYPKGHGARPTSEKQTRIFGVVMLVLLSVVLALFLMGVR